MASRIILHIGSPKCGSTYLQRVLLNNSESLLAHGISYPSPKSGHPGNAADLINISGRKLEKMFSGHVQTLILSHEDLYYGSKQGETLAVLAREMKISVQVVAFIRPFSEFIFSDYSQFMKQNFETYLKTRNPFDGYDFPTFARLRVKALTPAVFLKNWETVFHHPSPILQSYRNIRPVFERLLGRQAVADWRIHKDKTNQSLRVEDCERIAAGLCDPDRKKKELWAMFREAFHNTGEPDAGRSPERIAMIEGLFASENKALLKHLGYNNYHPDFQPE